MQFNEYQVANSNFADGLVVLKNTTSTHCPIWTLIAIPDLLLHVPLSNHMSIDALFIVHIINTVECFLMSVTFTCSFIRSGDPESNIKEGSLAFEF